MKLAGTGVRVGGSTVKTGGLVWVGGWRVLVGAVVGIWVNSGMAVTGSAAGCPTLQAVTKIKRKIFITGLWNDAMDTTLTPIGENELIPLSRSISR